MSALRADHPDSMYVACDDCPKVWRYGCRECGEDFIASHRRDTGHHIHESSFGDGGLAAPRRPWWEAGRSRRPGPFLGP